MSGPQESQARARAIQYALVAMTIVAITVSAYGQMTGVNAIVVILKLQRYIATVLFSLSIGFSALSSALVLSRLSTDSSGIIIICTISIAGASFVVTGADTAPAEWVRFFAATVATVALPVLGALNVYTFRTMSRRGNLITVGVRRHLMVAAVSLTVGVAFYIMSNLLNSLKGFCSQNIMILLIAVAPLVSMLAALSAIAQSRRLAWCSGAVLAIIAAACTIAMTAL